MDSIYIDLAKKYFDFGLNFKMNPIDYEDKVIKEVIYKKDKTKSTQSQLVIKYRCYTRVKDSDYVKMILFERLFGGFSSSLLFTNVREKNSLCYSISSTYSQLKGVITIAAGINAKDYDNAVKLIFEQLEEVKRGNFSDELLEMAKLSLISGSKKSKDSLYAISKKIYSNELLDKELDFNEYNDEIKNLTKEDIISVANKLKLDLVYLLEGSVSSE